MTTKLEEKELIERCLAGEKKAEKLLYQQYAGKMMSVCMRYMGSRSKAEDILQEGFMKLFKSLNKFSFSGSFEGYVRRIMVNCAFRELNRFRNKNEFFGYEYETTESKASNVVQKMAVDDIMKLISRLPEGYRMVFNLYIIDGYSHREIADMMNIAESTSRSQLTKARKMLQGMILENETIQP